jgi:hypothetical protein
MPAPLSMNAKSLLRDDERDTLPRETNYNSALCRQMATAGYESICPGSRKIVSRVRKFL